MLSLRRLKEAIRMVNRLHIILFTLLAFLIILVNNFFKNVNNQNNINNLSRHSMKDNILNHLNKNIIQIDFPLRERFSDKHSTNKCSLQSCFDLHRCHKDFFKIYVYKEPAILISKIYKEIIKVFLDSSYITSDPNEACLFVASIDTLDRDILSKNYVENMRQRLVNLEHWNNGRNHIIFNLYSGSWPDYEDNHLGLDETEAIFAKASYSIKNYRKHFDISFPLFHPELPFKNQFSNETEAFELDLTVKKKFLLTFKGKRYLNGIGSETRNSLYHLNNQRDVLLLTTCKHGSNWAEFKDERCDSDEIIYNK